MHLDLLDLRVLRAIAATGSITGAAAALGYSQPAVTQRLRRAEALVGHPLALRSGRGIVLTEAGRRMALHAVRVQAALDAAAQDLEALTGGATGTLRLAGFPSASPTLVPPILSSLRDSHPGVTVTYVEVEPPEALDLLRDGAIDLALTFSYPGDGRATGMPGLTGGVGADRGGAGGLVERPLFRDTTVVVAPAGSFGTEPLDLAALSGARFIGGCPRCRGHLLATCRTAGFEPDIVLETDNALAVTGLVAAGLGVALLPALSLVPTRAPSSVEVRPLPEAGDRILQAAFAEGADGIPVVRAALAAIGALDPATFGLSSASEPLHRGAGGSAAPAVPAPGATSRPSGRG